MKKEYLSWAYHPSCLALPCVFALGCRFILLYLVAVDSMSIIFVSGSMTSAVFNSLALFFVNELNSYYWDFITTILNLDKLEEFQFKERKEVVKEFEKGSKLQDRQSRFESALKMLNYMKAEGLKSPDCDAILLSWFPWLSRGAGFRRFQNAACFFLLGGIYLQQLFVMCFALMTNVLPMARDVCTWWRWSHMEGNTFGLLGTAFVRLVDFVTLVQMDLDGEVAKVPVGGCRKQNGSTGMYYRMEMGDRLRVMFGGEYTSWKTSLKDDGKSYAVESITREDKIYQHLFWFGFTCVLVMVIAPQFSAISAQLGKCFGVRKDSDDGALTPRALRKVEKSESEPVESESQSQRKTDPRQSQQEIEDEVAKLSDANLRKRVAKLLYEVEDLKAQNAELKKPNTK
jgi:hypothetical protein